MKKNIVAIVIGFVAIVVIGSLLGGGYVYLIYTKQALIYENQRLEQKAYEERLNALKNRLQKLEEKTK